jgi:hypothetical protein
VKLRSWRWSITQTFSKSMTFMRPPNICKCEREEALACKKCATHSHCRYCSFVIQDSWFWNMLKVVNCLIF